MTPSLLDEHAWRLWRWRWHALAVGFGGLVLHHQVLRHSGDRFPRGTLGFALLGLLIVIGLLALACYLAAYWFDSRLGTLRRNQPKWVASDRWLVLRRYSAAAMVDFLLGAAVFALWLSWSPTIEL